MAKKKRKSGKSPSRRRALKLGVVLVFILAIWGMIAEWFVHHPRAWLNSKHAAYPEFLTAPLFALGNPLADLTDALDLTGHDAVYEYDMAAPNGQIFFAGAPARLREPAPSDIRLVKRGEFTIGWSDSLRHPVWCAYHITRDARYPVGKRPSFLVDKSIPRSPHPNDYTKSGYDRGHMVPNYAIATRYGDAERRKTFLMSNIVPQTPALNRGVWRELEHRIAELWTARYGEIWVIVGTISSPESRGCLGVTDIDVPSLFYQIVIAQEGMDVRAMAFLFRQDISWREWPARNLISIDKLEELTGLDFNPDMPSFIQDPLEAELPSRLWPIRLQDIPRLIGIRFQ